MKEQKPLVDNSKAFAVDICYNIEGKAILINQLLRSVTSISANIHEAQYAHSKNNFITKLEIALKESGETSDGLQLLLKPNYISKNQYSELENLCTKMRFYTPSLRNVKRFTVSERTTND